MADIDLKSALDMFSDGANQLMLSRAISGANDQVQQIRASEMDEQAKRAQLTNVSNNLVAHMAGIGTPATTIQAVQGIMQPKQYANANDMAKNAVLTGNDGLMDQAKTLQGFEQDPEYKMELMKAKWGNPLKASQMQAMADEHFQKHIESVNKVIDTQTTRFGNISKLQGVNNRIQDAMTMLQDPSQITRLGINETARVFDSILSQGSSTVAGTHEVTPSNLKLDMAKSMEYLTSKPKNVDLNEFVNFYKTRLQKIAAVNDKIITDSKIENIKSLMPGLAKLNPDLTKNYIKTKLPGYDADIDEKTGKISIKKSDSAPADAPPAPIPMMMRDKNTGAMIKVNKMPDGSYEKAE